MSTATVRELRNHYTTLLSRVAAGEEVTITQRGKPVARLSPVRGQHVKKVDWSRSAALAPRATHHALTEKQTRALWDELRGEP
jgi:prevent-host-death family protein